MSKLLSKLAYFQGGGGVNEPTPGKKKYKSDPAIVVQPRFKEPFYRNYDLYTIPGMEDVGPGTGWHGLQNYKSVSEFLEARRERLKPRYVADDSWIQDNGERTKNPNIKVRAELLNRIIKIAKRKDPSMLEQVKNLKPKDCKDSDIEYTDGRDAYICARCLHMGPNDGGPAPTSKQFHAWKDHNPDRIDWTNEGLNNRRQQDENDGSNFDYGHGAYDAMNQGKKMKSITDFKRTSPGAFFTDDNADHMLPPKEHGTEIYDWKNSPYQGKPKSPKKDSNDIDFPIDEQVNHQDEMIYPSEETYHNPTLVGPEGGNGNKNSFPSDTGTTDQSSYINSTQIAGEHSYLPLPDEEDRSGEALDFGRDYTGDVEFPGNLNEDDLKDLSDKYINPAESDLLGLPDGIDPNSDLDSEETQQIENPNTGISDIGTQPYEDKWNI